VQPLTIGQLAKQAGVETVRFYGRRGLLDKPLCRASGYRQYAWGVVARLQFIKRAKELGFSLKEIGELLSLRVDPETTCDEVKKRAEAKIAKGSMVSSATGAGRILLQSRGTSRAPGRDVPRLPTYRLAPGAFLTEDS
jgi:hypothetical protein